MNQSKHYQCVPHVYVIDVNSFLFVAEQILHYVKYFVIKSI